MKSLALLAAILFVSTLISAPRLWASEKNEFQVIPESVHFYKGKANTTDNLTRNVDVERFIATRMEANKKRFISAVLFWDPTSGLLYWISAPYPDGSEPEPSDIEGKYFDVTSYFSDENIYLSKIGIASWRMFRGENLVTRGFTDRFKTLDDARKSVLSKLSEMTIDQIGQLIFKSLYFWKHVPDSFFYGSLPCGRCESHAKLTSVRVVGDKWLVLISGGYQTDAELVLDANFDIRKICIHPSAEQTK